MKPKAPKALAPPPVKNPMRRRRGQPGATRPLTDEEKAQIWILAGENRSSREIGDEVGVDGQTVLNELHRDPARLSALTAQQAEMRKRAFERVFNGSARFSANLIAASEELLRPADGKRPKLTEDQKEWLGLARGFLQALRGSMETSATHVALLSGLATQRVETKELQAVAEWSEEDLVRYLTERGLEAQIPPGIRDRMKRGALPGAEPGACG